MPDVIVHAGPYAGTYDGLESLLEAQGERQHSCLHPNERRKPESGVAGRGLDRFEWNRVRCLDCMAVMPGDQYMHSPDMSEARRMRDDFLRRLPDEPEGRFYVVMFLGSEWFVVWSVEASCMTVACQFVQEWAESKWGGQRCRKLFHHGCLEIKGKRELLDSRL